MNMGWQYFWPVFAAGLVAGTIGGVIGHRHKPFWRAALAGLAVAFACVMLWHGPLGAAQRFEQEVNAKVRYVLDDWEMQAVAGHLQQGPLTRRVHLSGPGDDFQRSQLGKIISQVPGVSSATWGDDRAIPMIVEALGLSLLGFLFGLLLAYLIELHRRHNAQWDW